MVAEEGILNLTEFISMLPPIIMEKVEGFAIILKAVGIVVLVYFVYLIVMGFSNFRNLKRVKHIEEQVDSIDKKLNILLKKKKK